MNGPMQLKPLALGQELKFLLRSVPNVHIAVEPAAALADVEQRVKVSSYTTRRHSRAIPHVCVLSRLTRLRAQVAFSFLLLSRASSLLT